MICSVPIVVLFTKFDALLTVAMGKLAPTDRKLPLPQRRSKAEALIEGIFHEADVQGRLSRRNYAPKSYVQIGGLLYLCSCLNMLGPLYHVRHEQVP